MGDLSKHFNLSEMTATSTGLPNIPAREQIECLGVLAERVLEPAREAFGRPIRINSGFRSAAVNAAVGGAKTSQHLKGQAADLDCDDNAALFGILREQRNFDQLIWEMGDDRQPAWVHVSVKPDGWNRLEVLRARKARGKIVYERM